MEIGSLLLGGTLAGLGFLLKRYISDDRKREQASLILTYADIAAKLRENSLTMPQVESLAAAIEGQRRKEQVLVEPAGSAPETHPYWTQASMNERAAGAAALADTQLQNALVELSPLLSELEIAALTETQVAWDLFRKRHVDFSGLDFSGGSLESLIRSTEHEAVALQRVAMLKAIIEERKARIASES